MCLVTVRRQNIECNPWQNSDVSDLFEKLPVLQEGVHPWISKFEELLVGTKPAMVHIKTPLANIIGVAAVVEVLQKSGIKRFVATARHSVDLLSAHKSLCLKGTSNMATFNWQGS